MPRAAFLLPGVGAQGGRVEDLAPAFAPGRAGGLVTASRSIARAHEQHGGAPGRRRARRGRAPARAAWALCVRPARPYPAPRDVFPLPGALDGAPRPARPRSLAARRDRDGLDRGRRATATRPEASTHADRRADDDRAAHDDRAADDGDAAHDDVDHAEQETYTVRAGDTLGAIAEETGVTVDELLELNPDVDPQSLTVGQSSACAMTRAALARRSRVAPARGRARAPAQSGAPDVDAPSAIVVEASTGDVAFERNASERRAIASTTKLMTALLTLEGVALDDVLTAVAVRRRRRSSRSSACAPASA